MSSSQNGMCILMWKHKRAHLLYIFCDMGFKDKTYGLNPLVVFQLQIELQQHRLNQLVNEHLNIQGKQGPRGRLCCFQCPNKNWTHPIGIYGTVKIIKNRMELRKLWPPKVEGVNNSKKQTTECYKGWFLNTQKFLVCCSADIKVQRWFVEL